MGCVVSNERERENDEFQPVLCAGNILFAACRPKAATVNDAKSNITSKIHQLGSYGSIRGETKPFGTTNATLCLARVTAI